jgi:glycine/D-amino acid oxidase-like deaminating enzyme
MQNDLPDVIVVGAGVVGAATTHALAQAGTRVVVVDGGQVAAGASAATFAADITRVKTPRALFDLSVASAREHAALQREYVDDSWLHPAGCLEWERLEGDRQRVRDRVWRLHAWGYPAGWLPPQRVRDVEPALVTPHDAAEVVFYPGGGWYEPPVFARALLARAQQQRATLHLNDPLTSLAADGRSVEATTASCRRLSADMVVNCAGPQAAHVAALAGANLPLWRVPGLVVTTTPASMRLRTILAAADLNIRPHTGNRMVLHSWRIDAELAAARELRALAERLLDRARTLLPGLAGARVQSALVGVRPIPPDGQPIVGFLPDAKNLYTVVSHSAVHLAPILGRLAASELTGTTQDRLSPFRPTRFRPGQDGIAAADESTRTMLARIHATPGHDGSSSPSPDTSSPHDKPTR